MRPNRSKTRVYKFIVQHIAEHGYAPTMREIAAALGIWPSTAMRGVHALAREGVLSYVPGKPRTIRVLKPLGGNGQGDSAPAGAQQAETEQTTIATPTPPQGVQ